MQRKEFTTESFRDPDVQAKEVAKWQSRYHSLVAKLGSLGTQVQVSRTLERDQDIFPHRFVRKAVHAFIFPPQEVTEIENTSGVLDSTPGYSLVREQVRYDYDQAKVKGRLRVFYDDASSRIDFSVFDDLDGGSELPEAVLNSIDSAMANQV